MKKKNIVLVALALVLVLTATVGSALAYFTTYVSAQGRIPIRLGTTTTIDEPDVTEFTKHVYITNTGAAACYVRARGFSASEYPLTYSGEGWSDGGDGWWYYDSILPGVDPNDESAVPARTTELLVAIGNVPADEADVDAFNVVVVYESAPAALDSSGEVVWNQSAIVDNDGEGG
ncbi:MAG: hypothetical protein IJ751_01970 [Oscillospiraceae bacterium]|nr:hypothetical protein [Oscillospiraceae bacterium]